MRSNATHTLSSSLILHFISLSLSRFSHFPHYILRYTQKYLFNLWGIKKIYYSMLLNFFSFIVTCNLREKFPPMTLITISSCPLSHRLFTTLFSQLIKLNGIFRKSPALPLDLIFLLAREKPSLVPRETITTEWMQFETLFVVNFRLELNFSAFLCNSNRQVFLWKIFIPKVHSHQICYTSQ